jgi:hypothetical protein
MKKIDKARATEWVVVALLLSVCWFGGDRYGRARAFDQAEQRRDTVTKIVTVYKDAPQPAKTAISGYVAVPAYKFITDTVKAVQWAEIAIPVHDTTVVYLPREQKYYDEEDGRLKVWISGYEPSLDRYEVSWPETTITQTVIPKKRWSLGVTAGYGLSLQDQAVILSPFVGVGFTYAFLSF